MTAHEFAPGLVIQGFTPPLRLGDFKLIAFDMDSTLINIECVDEIADAFDVDQGRVHVERDQLEVGDRKSVV